MEQLKFVSYMNRGEYNENSGAVIENSRYCIFSIKGEEPPEAQGIFKEKEEFMLQMLYFEGENPCYLCIWQNGTNIVIEEPENGKFVEYIKECNTPQMGHVIMQAVRYIIEKTEEKLFRCDGELEKLEYQLDKEINNKSIYNILEFRRKFARYGESVIVIKDIISRINKGYFPTQMQNSYVIQGEVGLEFDVLEERFNLYKSVVVRDFDTYTSIVNNNIARNTRLLSILSLVGIIINFLIATTIVLPMGVGLFLFFSFSALIVAVAIIYKFGNMYIEKNILRRKDKF